MRTEDRGPSSLAKGAAQGNGQGEQILLGPSRRRPRLSLIGILILIASVVGSSIYRKPSHEGLPLVAADHLPPSSDPFYAAPSNLSLYAPGAIVRSRSVPTGTIAKASYQLAFRTTSAHGQAQLGITTTLVPPWSRVPSRLISFQLFQNSVHVDCSVSYSILPNCTGANKDLAGATDAIASLLLLLGYTVALPDHLGPESAFTVGKQQGFTTLDSIRASLSHRSTVPWRWGVKSSMIAYSGGASATAWAAQLQPSYAPELRFVGAALGGLPVDPATLIPNLDGTKNMGLGLAALVGMANVYDDMDKELKSKATERGLEAIKGLRSGHMCLEQLLSAHAGMSMSDFFTDLSLEEAPFSDVLEENRLGAQVARMPMYLWHGVQDDTTPIADVDDYVRSQCSRGARIAYSRDGLSDHVSAATPFTILSALLWLEGRYSLPLVTSLPRGRCATRTQGNHAGAPWLPDSGLEWWEKRRSAIADVVGDSLAQVLGGFAKPVNETVGSDG